MLYSDTVVKSQSMLSNEEIREYQDQFNCNLNDNDQWLDSESEYGDLTIISDTEFFERYEF